MAIAAKPDRAIARDVVELAKRLGAGAPPEYSQVRLTQRGSMRSGKRDPWRGFTATQSIQIAACGFEWRARTAPLKLVHITDALHGDHATLDVSLLGLIPLTRLESVAALVRGELIRYLAELPYAPDAILANPRLIWSWQDGDVLAVAAKTASGVAEVLFGLDQLGRIGTVRALRPRYENGVFTERPWRGRFYDYRRSAGRWIPFRAEVAWMEDGAEQCVWRGELTSWAAA